MGVHDRPDSAFTIDRNAQAGHTPVVYLRGGLCDGEGLFILYGADGSPIAIPDDVESVMEMVAAWGLDLASIH
jgi:hypothetical protein